MNEHTVTIDGRELTVSVDTSDYPEFIIESVVDDEGEEVDVDRDLEFELYMQLGAEIASDMASDAEFLRDLAEDR